MCSCGAPASSGGAARKGSSGGAARKGTEQLSVAKKTQLDLDPLTCFCDEISLEGAGGVFAAAPGKAQAVKLDDGMSCSLRSSPRRRPKPREGTYPA